MAQTIKIKRSTGSSAPSALANGELAYLQHANHKKLYIGRPGGGTGDIDVIGGKDFTDKVDTIEINADVTDATNVTAAGALMDSEVTNLAQVKAFNTSDYATSAQGTLATNALARTGGTLTGDIVLQDNKKIGFGTSAASRLEITHDGTTARIEEVGSGGLEFKAEDFNLRDSNSADIMSVSTTSGVRNTKFSDQSGAEVVKIFTGRIEVKSTSALHTDDIKETTANHGVEIDSVLIKDNTVTATTFTGALVGNATTATTATNVNLVADNSSSDQHRIIFANSQTGSQTLQTDTSLVYQPSTGNLSLGSGGTASMGNLTLNSGTINSVQTIKGTSTLTIDPHADGATGEVVIQGNLTVKGATTTIDSNTISVGDNIIRLNGDLASDATPTQDAGIEVDRGGSADVGLFWDESASQWVVSDASGVSPYQYPILQTRTAHLQTYTIDGGSF